jgi:hypothetical protein
MSIFLIIIIIAAILIFIKISSDKKDKTFEIHEYQTDNFLQIETQEKPKQSLEQITSKIQIIRQKDDFEDTEFIYFSDIMQDGRSYMPMYYEILFEDLVSSKHIGLSFGIFQNFLILQVNSIVTEMGLAKGDSLILIFENREKIVVTFDSLRSSGFIKTNSYVLTPEELKLFATVRLDKWKLISKRRNIYIVGDNSIFHESSGIEKKEDAQEILKYLAKTIIQEYLRTNKNSTTHNNVYNQLQS